MVMDRYNIYLCMQMKSEIALFQQYDCATWMI